MSFFFIVNPAAGRGRALRAWNTLESMLESQGIEYNQAHTDGPGHATELARLAASQGYSACIGVGGDGTLHEMLTGLIGTQTALGCVPAGTGNDFARSLRIPREISAQLAWLSTAERARIDVPMVNGHPFLNAASAGFDAVVADTVNRKFRAFHGTLPYLMAAVKTLVQYRNVPLTIRLAGREPIKQKSLLVAVGNLQYYGGGIKICPGADPADGLLNFCIAGDLTKTEVLGVLPKTFSGSHIGHPKCLYLTASAAQIDGPPLPVQTDGQIVGTLPATFALQPGALWVLKPITR